MSARGRTVTWLLALAASAAGAAAPGREAPIRETTGPSVHEELTIGAYLAALVELERSLEAEEWDESARVAEALRGLRVSDGRSRFEADPSVLAAASAAHDRAGSLRAQARLRALRESLDEREGSPPGEVDAQRLARLAREEAARRPQAGGEVDASLELVRPSVSEQMREWLLTAARWLGDGIERLFEWLGRVLSRGKVQGGTKGSVAVLVAVIAVLLAIATAFSLRRRDPVDAAGEAETVPSARDQDPLSRESNEWERYAAELAGSGRRREAIRAWYHAVLVALFRAGQIHHQKGRTNWEYVAQVGPQAVWKGSFVRLTETFDREWYGREASALDTLREHASRAKDLLRAVRGGEAAV